MSHRLLAGMLASLALIAGGCGSGEPENLTGETPSPEPTQGEASPVPTQPLATKPEEPAKVTKKAPSASAGLLGSTNPEDRAQQVQAKINAERNAGTQATTQSDPFSTLPVPPARVKLPEAAAGTAGGGGTGTADPTDSSTVASLPTLPPVTAQIIGPVPDAPTLFVPSTITASLLSVEAQIAEPAPDVPTLFVPPIISQSSEAQPAASLPPLDGPALPPDEPVASLPPLDGEPLVQLPPLPVEIGPALPPAPVEPPSIAETITITGVVQVGDEIQVIVQLPGSSTGRYVTVGDLIANGQVRVKRVEGIQGSNPIVILEEEGVEYARAVGDVPMIAMEEPDRG
jgi:hypothetical protein